MKKLLLLCSTAAILAPATAYAQSTGSVDFENEAIVVTGSRTQEVGGVKVPDTVKPKAVLTQEYINRQNPGQTILDTINVVPGVSFQNNDAYGSSGGTLTIRGFDSSRISLTFDGVPLNDSGNYAIYSNQQIDPELIEQVNVNLGTTDVDSPTASAVGGTVNYRTITPSKSMGGRGSVSLGEFDFRRFFGLFQTGELGPWGTRAFISASSAKNDNPFNNYGKVDKQQYNAKIWQPFGADGDFVSIAGHYNQNRNNFFGSLPLRWDLTQSATNPAPREVSSGSSGRFPRNNDEREYDINYPCRVDVAQAGVADSPNSCGTEFDRRYNPSNTGNIRINSRFTLADGLVLTVDPSFQYVKANGGGTSTAREFGYDINPTGGRANCSTTPNGPAVSCVGGYFGGSPYLNGVDLNGDGDLLDQVTVVTPSQTRTRRYGLIAGLRYDLSDDHTVRVAYTFDRANHRQTGQVGFVQRNGEPEDVFPINDPIAAASGFDLQKRDRQSYATLNKVAAEYRGEFGALTVNVGAALPFFKRDLENNCFTSSANGFVECSGGDATLDGQIADLNPYVVDPVTGLPVSGFSPPGQRVLKYHKFLPSVGAIYDFTNQISAFVSYSKNISVPGTDNLYNAFYFPAGTSRAKPEPETTDTVDAGIRYRSGRIQAQIAGWFTRFENRLASAYDPELDRTVYRNLGRVNKWGIDGSIAYEPIRELTLYAFGSLNRSKIKDDLQFGTCTNAYVSAGILGCSTVGDPVFLDTSGNTESGAPTYTLGGSAVGRLGPFELGVVAKRTGPRYVFDTNVPTFRGPIASPEEIFPSKAPAYWLVNLDARYNLRDLGPELKNTYLQLNVYNLFDTFYVGGFGGGASQSFSGVNYGNPGFVQIGAPRTISGTLSIGF